MTEHVSRHCQAAGWAPPGSCRTRRSLLVAAGAVTAGAALAGCQVYGETPPAAPAAPAAPGGAAGPTGAGPEPTGAGPEATGPAAAEPPAAPPLARLADIPVGGGKIFAEQNVVITQPEQGTVKAFSTTCTHQGCAVSEVADGTVNCLCHNSRFRVTDGSVQSGPAGSPLAEMRVVVQGDAIRLG